MSARPSPSTSPTPTIRNDSPSTPGCPPALPHPRPLPHQLLPVHEPDLRLPRVVVMPHDVRPTVTVHVTHPNDPERQPKHPRLPARPPPPPSPAAPTAPRS